MSTLFAVKIDGTLHNVVLRHNGGRIEVINELILGLRNKRRVYAIDNTQQGIYTIQDIKNEITTNLHRTREDK